MEKDFYLDDRGLAAYFEKDWIDHVDSAAFARAFRFAPIPIPELYSDYHERLSLLIDKAVARDAIAPVSMLEVGSSLGRGFYELCKVTSSLRQATLLEPSQNLYRGFQSIFFNDSQALFPLIKGFALSDAIPLETAEIRQRCAHIEVNSLNLSYQEFKSEKPFDLVICSNVIDQCKDPRVLAEFLKAATAPNGTLVLSCTYQWQNKYTGNAAKLIENVQELFGPGWQFLDEANFPFHVRSNERHWLKFLSHVVIYRNHNRNVSI